MVLKRMVKTFRIFGNALLAELNVVLGAVGIQEKIVTPTWGAAISLDLSLGSLFIVTATSNVAYTVGAPTNTPLTGFGQVLTLTIKNTSGAPLGAATFNAIFKLGAAWTNPATGFSRTIQFRWDGTNWVEINRTAADVAN